MTRATQYLLMLFLLLMPPLVAQEPAQEPADSLTPRGAVRGVHDPAIIHAGSTWYVFSTGGGRGGAQLPIHCSEDLIEWRACGYVLPAIPPWILERLPGVHELWAPDISFHDGQFWLYYVYSIYGKNTSGIALVTNTTLDPANPDYHWVDRGTVLESVADDDWNAIDPSYIADEKGQGWLAFGSYWGGIQMRRLGADGLLDPKQHKQYRLATRRKPDGVPDAPPRGQGTRDWLAIEAPFVVHHGDWFYLFTSWDLCCRAAQSNYRVMVGRSRHVNGPYEDRDGQKLSKGGGTEVLGGDATWAGPGGQSVARSPDGQEVMVFHAYSRADGHHALQIGDVSWTDGWPMVAWRGQ